MLVLVLVLALVLVLLLLLLLLLALRPGLPPARTGRPPPRLRLCACVDACAQSFVGFLIQRF